MSKASRKARKAARKHYRKVNVLAHKDYHHFLWCKKDWQKPYAKLLRDHPYMGRYLPRFTLHAEIHHVIDCIPCPSEKLCKKAYLKLLELSRSGEIDDKFDSCERRLDFLIFEWANVCPETVNALRLQKQIISSFYEGSQ